MVRAVSTGRKCQTSEGGRAADPPVKSSLKKRARPAPAQRVSSPSAEKAVVLMPEGAALQQTVRCIGGRSRCRCRVPARVYKRGADQKLKGPVLPARPDVTRRSDTGSTGGEYDARRQRRKRGAAATDRPQRRGMRRLDGAAFAALRACAAHGRRLRPFVALAASTSQLTVMDAAALGRGLVTSLGHGFKFRQTPQGCG